MGNISFSDLLTSFVNDMFVEGVVDLIALQPGELFEALQLMQTQSLDFDDAYQYAAAKKHNLVIVSLDPDFDRTERGRMTPAQALEHFKQQPRDT